MAWELKQQGKGKKKSNVAEGKGIWLFRTYDFDFYKEERGSNLRQAVLQVTFHYFR